MHDSRPRRPSAAAARCLVASTLCLTAACGRAVAPAFDGDDVARREDAHGIAQVYVPPGAFRMASAEQAAALTPPGWAAGELKSEQPQHDVRIGRGFWIDTFEVTNEAFQAFVDARGYSDDAFWSADGLKWLATVHRAKLPVDCTPGAPADHPRVCVTWYEAEAYARWRGGRLPTEAEWEYAARGPEGRVYPWGDDWDAAKANVADSTGLTPVGSLPGGASWVGAHDMAGNAMEWVADWLDGGYYQQLVDGQRLVDGAAGSAVVDPTGPATGAIKIEKGGWWGGDPFAARAAYRHFEDGRSYQDHHIGFRVVTDAPTE